MSDLVFTAITFSPVTEFIEKTRKLRDLYGSSFILSYLAESICREAQQQLGVNAVVSPALLNITMGTPDQIVIQGDFPKEVATRAFLTAWDNIMDACREWICQNCNDWIDTSYQQWVANGEWHRKESRTLPWNRDWQHWKNYAWELFWAQGATIPDALEALAHQERNRNWVGVNWMGESSTLSGADAIAWPGLGLNISPKQRCMKEADVQIREFFQVLNLKIGEAILEDDLSNPRKDHIFRRLSTLATRYNIDPRQREQPDHPEHQSFRQELAQNLGEAIITNREQLSILELTKRLFTLKAVVQTLPDSEQLQKELPDSFSDVNLWKTDQPMGWFRGDGDQAGQYIRKITHGEDAVEQFHHFSHQMRQWGKSLKQTFDQRLGRIIFAGGDDFLGVFYPSKNPTAAIDWICNFKESVWHMGKDNQPDRKPITPSLGFVWASPQVPQRDVLQHCELAERTAKENGRDRVCLRILFSNATYLEWICPWWLLEAGFLGNYRDRNGGQNWTHIYNDVAVLEARHAFEGDQIDVAIALFAIYFPNFVNQIHQDDQWWNRDDDAGIRTFSGILGDRENYETNGDLEILKVYRALSDWLIDLAKVGFHLCSNS